MPLRIEQTSAQLGAERTPSQLEMHNQMWRLELHQNPATVNIHSDPPKVIIDQHEAFASAGLKNNGEIIAEAAGNGYQRAMEYIAQKVEEGDTMAAVEKSPNAIPSIAEQSSHTEHVFDIDYIPKVGPKIDFVGSLDIEVETSLQRENMGVDTTVIPGGLSINYTPSKLNFYMARYNSIQFYYESGGKVDVKL